ncbi:MAG: hypothetical protein C0410_13135 [Anaerolinea sp.]|nr:hypothetical protein [Anaerolinea sp.]
MKKPYVRTSIILIFLGVLFVLISLPVRLGLVNPQPFARFILEFLSSFGPGLGLPGIFFLVLNHFLGDDDVSMKPKNLLFLAAAISLSGLYGWRFVQYFAWRMPVIPIELMKVLAGVGAFLITALWCEENRKGLRIKD